MFTFNYKKTGLMGFFAVLNFLAIAQDTTKAIPSRQEAVYNRPFIQMGQSRTAVGGYVEGNTNYFSEDGVSEGFSMELRRFNIFLYTQIHPKIKFLSELEFEHGTEEIALETALIDFTLHPAFNIRAGVILPNIGLVNTNHDSPNWEFIERPLTSTQIIPTTLSEIGFGIYGKFYPTENIMLNYDAYIVNGLQDGVISNGEGRTFLGAGKSEEMFGEDNNGLPMFNLHVGLAHRKFGEIGMGYYGGVYNTFRLEGEEVAPRRKLHLLALDAKLNVWRFTLLGELVWANIQVPDNIDEIYGTKQTGKYIELQYPVFKGQMGAFKESVVATSIRAEMIDYNKGNFKTNINTSKGDEITALSLGLSLRLAPGTIIRANYRFQQSVDLLNNPPANLGGFQFGVATYF